ncbi:hypothetical protein PV327_001661 [Microctonus hyperodae]|uniref:Uncharacterized protein n=1 Tax=Microctonus hyperodae TaxID=165561 RepID=A0AA39KNC7_MICHY|nr:hypothetical protein PV327_001661 [Microctonus hyperodae]
MNATNLYAQLFKFTSTGSSPIMNIPLQSECLQFLVRSSIEGIQCSLKEWFSVDFNDTRSFLTLITVNSYKPHVPRTPEHDDIKDTILLNEIETWKGKKEKYIKCGKCNTTCVFHVNFYPFVSFLKISIKIM